MVITATTVIIVVGVVVVGDTAGGTVKLNFQGCKRSRNESSGFFHL